jgi:AcrR family transcriptional regulator
MNEKQIKIINAAQSVFLKYGYKRVTMQDLSDAAGMSRPALYLIFANKEEVFKAVVKYHAMQNLERIRSDISRIASPEEQLQYAFEMWTVRSYELVMTSPDAKELIYSCHEFSTEVFEEVGALFEEQLVDILVPVMKTNTHHLHTPASLAHLLRSAARGLKDAAKSSAELRQMLNDLLSIIFAVIKLMHQ